MHILILVLFDGLFILLAVLHKLTHIRDAHGMLQSDMPHNQELFHCNYSSSGFLQMLITVY